jgi:hypothetical protein
MLYFGNKTGKNMAHMAIEAICPKHHRFERFRLDIIKKMNVKADTWEIIEKRPNYETTGVLIGRDFYPKASGELLVEILKAEGYRIIRQEYRL